jgi:cleavage and polyadenylation specificity factor subunit 3
MKVYKTYVNMMNDRIRAQVQVENPFAFRFVQGLSSMDQFEDSTCVVMASPVRSLQFVQFLGCQHHAPPC